jgi:hypothetical protein
MNDATTIDRAMQAQMDRLAVGELPESERRSLLAWLDEDVRRWRACAMAFLEAQTWEAAVVDWPPATTLARSASEGNRASICESAGASVAKPAGQPRPQWTAPIALAIAISLIASFAMGTVAARRWSAPPARDIARVIEQPFRAQKAANDKSRPVLATVPVRTGLGPHLPARLQFPVTLASSASPAVHMPAIPDYERKQLEKRGFELVEEVRYLPARLPDGRQVMVPVTKVQLKFKGTPVS